MTRVRAAVLSALAFVGVIRLIGAEPAATIQTNDRLELRLDRDGKAAALRLDGRDATLIANPALFYVRDAAVKSRFTPVTFTVAKSGDEILLRSQRNTLNLELTARISSRGGFLELDGSVSDRTLADRCIDLEICLPIDTNGLVLGGGLSDGAPTINAARAAKEARNDAEIDGSIPDDNARYPLCSISGGARGLGLTLAVPPTHPTRFLTGSDASGTHILLRIGLSADSAVPSQTPFRVILYRHDPQWGFRSALDRYYAFYRENFFTRRVKRIGAWTTQNASKLKNPHLYAYHEAGFPTWRHPAGTESGVNVKLTLELLDEGSRCNSLEDYEQLCELALDEKLGIYSLPYTIVGQCQLLQLPKLPSGYAESMQVLDNWVPAAPILFEGPPQAVSFRSADELKRIVRNSTLHDASHRLAFIPRPYRGPTLTFPQNPNPNLYKEDDRPTVAKYILDYYLPMMLRSKFIDGCYLDSLGRWCSLYNYRRDHFKYSTVPLTYAGDPAQPCLWNLQSHAEYLWELRRRLRAQDKIVVANGVHADRVMLGFASDVMGAEGGGTYNAGEAFYALRVAAGAKPYCVLNASHRVSPRLWNSCLYMGYLMGCNDPKGLADEARYLPAIIKCNEAGWAPVTHARATPATVGVERWGGQASDDSLMFTVMNRSTEPVRVRLTIDAAALHRSQSLQVSSPIDALAIDMQAVGRDIVLQFQLAAEQATVLELRPR